MHPTANIIAKFGAAIGIDGLETENGVCTLQFDDVTVTLECAENGDALYLYSRVCGLPESDADKLALYGLLRHGSALKAMAYGNAMAACKCTFADEEHLKSWLIRVTINHCKSRLRAPWHTRRLPLEHLDEAILDRQVGRHVDTVESLRASIAQLREQAATPQAAAEAGWNDGMLKI